jgi:dihydrofolate synthase/folylpolyglutamate synthase
MPPAPPCVRDYASALEFLLGSINYERTSNIPYRSAEFKLDRMRRLLALVGDPHLAVKAVHIAGTKGKGSTAAMLAAVLQAAGYRTGLYTSPHLSRIEERIAVDGVPCGPEEFAGLAAELEAALARLGGPTESGATFFEITTAMAFLHFARRPVEIAVLEVGLGGRLDSTNVCRPEVAIITSISFDHMRQLGNTLAAIAGEKAGIIKPQVPVVSGVLADEPRTVIAARAAEVGAPLLQRGVDYGFAPAPAARGGAQPAEEVFDYFEPGREPRVRLEGVRLGMLGQHQAANAAAAIAACGVLRGRGWQISEAALRAGLAAARCPGRIEQVGSRPTLLLDVAHNPASIAALVEVLKQRFAGRRRIVVLASSRDKDYTAMLRVLLPACDVLILTRYVNNPRAMEPEGLLSVALALRESLAGRAAPALHAAAQPVQALALARRLSGPEDLVCITGSFFLAAELRPLLVTSTVEPPAGS